MTKFRFMKRAFLCCAAAVAAASGSASAEADFTAVWQIEGDATQLRALDGSAPPLTPWGRERFDANRKALANNDFSVDLTRLQCASPGPVRLMTLPTPVEFFQRPHQLTMLFGWNHHYRLVNLQPQPREAPYELSIGISNGHWEGDTLVVKTTDLTSNTLLDSAGLPHGDKTVVTERIRFIAADRIENRVTISDPQAFERDWTFRLTYRKTGAAGIEEDVCLDRIDAGHPAVILPVR